jgi:hypothetical protein
MAEFLYEGLDMKSIIFYSVLILLHCSCNQNDSAENTAKMVMGAPKAVVTSEPNSENKKARLRTDPMCQSYRMVILWK